jgi:fumarate reductase subunit D
VWKILQKSKNMKNDLLNFKDEPLTPVSSFLLIILNIFIFINVMHGVDAQRDKAPEVYYYYPSACSEYFTNIKTTYNDFNSFEYVLNNYYTLGKNKYCNQLSAKIDIFRLQKSFQVNSKLIKNIKNKQIRNKQRLLVITKNYNTRLFEIIASMPNNKALTDAKNEYDAITLDNKNLKKELESIPPLSDMKGYDDYVKYVKTNKKAFLKEKKSYKFWQPFKAYAYMLIFVAPLLLIFGFFYYKTKKKEILKKEYNPIVKIISANVTFILSLPLLWYTFTLIYHVLPKTLLKNIIEYLVSIGLLSIIDYVAIFLLVLIFGGIIYYIQKRTMKLKQDTSNDSKKQKLISWSKCFNCEFKIDYTKKHCTFCGIKLHENCISCDKKIIIYEKYCSNCGEIKIVNK